MQSLMIRISTLLLITSLFFIPAAHAVSKAEINAGVRATMFIFYSQVKVGKELAGKSAGILVFPDVHKPGFGIGGAFGEGTLLEGGKTTGYYSTTTASVDLHIGAYAPSEIIMFMTRHALNAFKASNRWKTGVDGSVALVTIGAGGKINTNTTNHPIIGFIFSNEGVLYNLTFEGSEITKIKK